jgi:hypothetical protein
VAEEDDVTEYELDEYTVAERRDLTEMLITARITHRWLDSTLIVPTPAEALVDGLLDELEGDEVIFDDIDVGSESDE